MAEIRAVKLAELCHVIGVNPPLLAICERPVGEGLARFSDLTSLLILFGLPLGVAVEKEVKLGRCHSV
jgi:hypothetical protein